MRENGIGINRGNPFLKKGGFTRAPSGERCGDLFEKKVPHPQKLLNYIIFQKAVLSYYSRTLQNACGGVRFKLYVGE